MEKEQKLFLLIRKISPYTGEDLFLGIYDEHDLANQQRTQYIQYCKTADPWKDQAYKEVDLEKDVLIMEVHEKITEKEFPSEGQQIFLVSGLLEGFGQIIKDLHSISTDKSTVKNFIETKHDELDNKDDFGEDDFNYYKDEEFQINADFPRS